MSLSTNPKVNQGDKPEIIEEILSYYRKGWTGYDIETLKEHLEDIKVPPNKNTWAKLTKEQIINILLTEDRDELNKKSYFELKKELYEYQTQTY